ncbi:hypothetical protein OAL97_02395 [Paracoccaceae bacterium]|nr:hypothetical protein [Paracoccaceae bacterium]
MTAQTGGQAGGKRVAKDTGAVAVDLTDMHSVPARRSALNLLQTARRIVWQMPPAFKRQPHRDGQNDRPLSNTPCSAPNNSNHPSQAQAQPAVFDCR